MCTFIHCLYQHWELLHYKLIPNTVVYREGYMKEKYAQQYKEIGLKIAYYRKLKGYSQMDFAEKIDISRTHLSNIEAPNVPTSISLDLLFKISEVLDIETKTFFEFTSLTK